MRISILYFHLIPDVFWFVSLILIYPYVLREPVGRQTLIEHLEHLTVHDTEVSHVQDTVPS